MWGSLRDRCCTFLGTAWSAYALLGEPLAGTAGPPAGRTKEPANFGGAGVLSLSLWERWPSRTALRSAALAGEGVLDDESRTIQAAGEFPSRTDLRCAA